MSDAAESTIAFINASGHGNIGDDTYPLVFEKYLVDCKLDVFGRGRNHSNNQDFQASNYDFVVIGGGGLIYAPNPNVDTEKAWRQDIHDTHTPLNHFQNMSYFIDQVISCGVPYGFVSCGIQLFGEEAGKWSFSGVEIWHKYFESASLITVRDIGSFEYIKPHMKNTHYVPDLAYLYSPPEETTGLKKQPYIVVCPNEYLAMTEQATYRAIEKYRSYGYKLVVVSMGGNNSDHPYVTKILENFEGTAFYDTTPSQVFHLIKNASHVITGRYHGLIFARSAGVPYSHPALSYKTAMEDETICNPKAAIKNISLLVESIKQAHK